MRTATSRTVGSIAGAGATVLAGSAFAASGGGEDGSGLVIWGFLGFCAVILVGQLLPAIINFLTARKVLERRIREELADKGKLERVHAVFDRE
jgi:uncharacterized membrane protein YdjX (TVP38/TMEM64 family)